MGAANEMVEVELKPRHLEYLREMVEKHGLTDESKALRCLINHAIDQADLESDVYDIIRCLDCSG